MREKWFERSFAFNLPVTRFPSVLERLRGTPARLEERARELAADVLTRSHGVRWTVQENVGHLVDLEPVWLKRAQQIFANEPELEQADLTNRRTHEANHNARSVEDLLAEFRAERRRLVQLLETADAPMLERTALHPRLRRPMRLIDLAEFVAEHDDHHLATIAELSD